MGPPKILSQAALFHFACWVGSKVRVEFVVINIEEQNVVGYVMRLL